MMISNYFNQIIRDIPIAWQSSKENLEIAVNGIKYDSRQVQQGDVYVALPGKNTDGHQYIEKAVANGAVIVVGNQPVYDWESLSVPYLQVEDSREALANLSAAFFGYPARFMTIIGVTGTDGKTTTCNLLYHILKSNGYKTGMISTVNALIGDQILDTGFHVTTPEAPAIQSYLKQMLDSGITHVIIEATSHGLAQKRVSGCEFDIAVVTNITHEHLDYHGTYESYLASKAKLFEMLAETKEKKSGNIRLGILNKDDFSYKLLENSFSGRKKTYAVNQEADLKAEQISFSKKGIEFIARGKDIFTNVHCHLIGGYNVSNCLAAMTAAIFGLGIDPHVAANGVASLDNVPGRMEFIDMGQEFTAVVDFAHTPNALQNVIKAARNFTTGKIITVFGSAGLRDREKRRMMAEISAKFSDISIITAEDPRTESLELILKEMGNAAEQQGALMGESLILEPDRAEALKKAVLLAGKNDTILACGKGHEQSMCFGDVEYPWDDRTAFKSAISQFLNVPGPAMPYLPTQDRDHEQF